MKTAAVISPSVKRLILVGGGHSHLSVLMHLARNPLPGLETVLITRDIHTPYSGALPAYIAGVYDFDQIHIDLRPLALAAGARLIHEEVTEVDITDKNVLLPHRPPLSFDALSLNIGSSPDADKIPGARDFALGVKPIDQFLHYWPIIKRTAVDTIKAGDTYTIAIVGGGPASVEMAFSIQFAINREVSVGTAYNSKLRIKIVSADSQLLMGHNEKVRDFASSELIRRGVELHLHHRVTEFRQNNIITENNYELRADIIIYATGASIPQWPFDCGLPRDSSGFIAVNKYLQCTTHPYVFACGDAATIEGQPRPKSGVYAVRQGKPLTTNLMRFLTHRSLRRYKPQKKALALMYTGDRKAIASRGRLFLHGRSIWRLKDSIDRSFVRKYSNFEAVEPRLNLARGIVDRKDAKDMSNNAMRCSGCGAKIGSSTLGRVLTSIQTVSHDDLVSDPNRFEDAALISVGKPELMVQTIDYLRAFISDPWIFARITANHCLSDIFAMGATPHSAMVLASIPYAGSRIMEETLQELMAGCVEVLNQHQTALLGGHSNEAADLGLGLSINGYVAPTDLLPKTGIQPGDVLVLCKPLGTGTLLAADSRLKAKGRWLDQALEQMLQSNAKAADCVKQHGANACTDVTGFGLGGHLLEMIQGQDIGIELDMTSLPLLDGALSCLENGIYSSLQQQNRNIVESIDASKRMQQEPLYQMLFDPQTSGGLLASVPQHKATACLEVLNNSGYRQAAIIGRASLKADESDTPVLLV